jgi:hypothetical protein
MNVTSVAIGFISGASILFIYNLLLDDWSLRRARLTFLLGGRAEKEFLSKFLIEKKRARRSALSVSRPPGWNLRRFAELCFSKKTFTHVLEPALSDMQTEHFEALAAGRPWKARMVLVRGYFSFWSAVAAQLPISFARRIYEVWKATKTGS